MRNDLMTSTSQRKSKAGQGRIAFEAPEYLIDNLKMTAVREWTTVKWLLLKALHECGYQLNESDLIEDCRRANGRKAA